MADWIPLVEPETAIEAEAIASWLQSQDVRYELAPHPPTATERETGRSERAWGFIMVAARDHALGQAILEDFRESTTRYGGSKREEVPPASSRGARWWGVLVTSLLVNVWLGYEYLLSGRFPWGYTTLDWAGKKVATFYYYPTNPFPHRIIGYDTRGTKTSECLDDEPDGRVEKCSSFYRSAEVGVSFDDDQDGLFDRGVLLDHAGGEIHKYSDEDDDGVFDDYRCRDEAGVKWKLDVRRCEARNLSADPIP